MKKLILAFVAITAFMYFMSCGKSTQGYVSCTNMPVTSDSAAFLYFARSNNITAYKDVSGLYYQIIDTGSGGSPVGTSKIVVSYVGKFLTGNAFDSSGKQAQFELDSLIPGWQDGIPKIQSGGRIKLLLPSALAYGCLGSNIIAPNTPVYFDITLVSFH
jgi:FKBP-type peptidyl-prolyl cis-trans isomerase FkpA